MDKTCCYKGLKLKRSVYLWAALVQVLLYLQLADYFLDFIPAGDIKNAVVFTGLFYPIWILIDMVIAKKRFAQGWSVTGDDKVYVSGSIMTWIFVSCLFMLWVTQIASYVIGDRCMDILTWLALAWNVLFTVFTISGKFNKAND